MSDEDKKRIVSEPPPPTDEIDGEWGDDEPTLAREVPEGVFKSQPAPPGEAVAGTAVAPISVPPKAAAASTPPEVKAATSAAADEDDEEEDEDDEDEDDDAAQRGAPRAAAAAGSDWIPDWLPYAVLAALVGVSILVGLGIVGGGSAGASEENDKAAEPAAPAPKAAVKPSPHP